MNTSEGVTERNRTILLVDDEELVLDIGLQMLKRLGYNTLGAKNGKEAVEIFKQKHEEIDIVILDVVMPGFSGGETFQQLKKIKPALKVLISSGYNRGGEAGELLDRGCDGFIQKPFRMQELSDSVKNIINQD